MDDPRAEAAAIAAEFVDEIIDRLDPPAPRRPLPTSICQRDGCGLDVDLTGDGTAFHLQTTGHVPLIGERPAPPAVVAAAAELLELPTPYGGGPYAQAWAQLVTFISDRAQALEQHSAGVAGAAARNEVTIVGIKMVELAHVHGLAVDFTPAQRAGR